MLIFSSVIFILYAFSLHITIYTILTFIPYVFLLSITFSFLLLFYFRFFLFFLALHHLLFPKCKGRRKQPEMCHPYIFLLYFNTCRWLFCFIFLKKGWRLIHICFDISNTEFPKFYIVQTYFEEVFCILFLLCFFFFFIHFAFIPRRTKKSSFLCRFF